MLLWPISSFAILIATPARWRSVQKVWRKQYRVKSGAIACLMIFPSLCSAPM